MRRTNVANAPKKKGTGGETEFLRLMDWDGLVRTPPTTEWDLELPGFRPGIDVLATRPDRGQWLVTIPAVEFRELLLAHLKLTDTMPRLRIEVKRYRRFSLHTIFEGKFGKGK
jgi:hypothetical protein